MIPPTGGRDEEPAFEAPSEPEPPAERGEEPAPQPYIAEPYVAATSSPRERILFFGILIGTLLAVLYALILTVLFVLTREPVLPHEQRFFSLFLTFLGPAAPWFILIAAGAAAVDALIRRSERDARLTRNALKTLAHRTRPTSRHVPERSAQEIVEPLQRELNMEIEPPRRGP